MADKPEDAYLKSLIDYINQRSKRRYHYHADEGYSARFSFYVQAAEWTDVGKPLFENLTRDELIRVLCATCKYLQWEETPDVGPIH